MNRSDIIRALDSEIAKLQQARSLLGEPTNNISTAVAEQRGKTKTSANVSANEAQASSAAKKRTMSPEGRARIAAAQKARWAKLHRSGTNAAPSKAVKKSQKVGRKEPKRT